MNRAQGARLLGPAISLALGMIVIGDGILPAAAGTRLAATADLSGACATQIPIPEVPAHVVLLHEGRPLDASTTVELQAGDEIRVTDRAEFTFAFSDSRYRVGPGRVRLECRNLLLSPKRNGPSTRTLVVELESGRLSVESGSDPRHAAVFTPEMLAYAAVPGTRFVVSRDFAARSTLALSLNHAIVAAKASDQALRINSRITYTAISDANGLRLDIWPFAISPLQRATTATDGLPAYWADRRSCSVGCTEPGAIPGWPIKPFHRRHAIRAGLNELRSANFHVAVDIEAHDGESVYSMLSGYASIRYAGTPEVNVDIGDFDYWHIHPAVHDGQYVVAYRTVIGHVLGGFHHVAFSEGSPADYLNPLRPGGSLQPYTDTEPPIIGTPKIFSDGRVIVGAFDPQSLVETGFPYETPVLAPSSLAWRLYDAHNHELSGLEWALRGSQNYPPYLKPVIFAPGAASPGCECFTTRRRCIPNWVYWLAGGLTRPLPLSRLKPGRYRLTVYAWDWTGHTSALDYWFTAPRIAT